MSAFDPTHYGPTIAELLRAPRLMALGGGEPVASVKSVLQRQDPDRLLAPAPVRDTTMAAACRAGLWLYFDFLDESHRISQEIENATGSYWHAIMHRREGDYANAKHWFRRAGNHPVLRELANGVTDMEGTGDLPTMGRAWDPITFVDLIESVNAGRSPLGSLCQQIQQREWELLFDHSYRRAV